MSDTAHGSRVGSRYGRYQLRRLLGRGGMGEVYEAEDTVKDRVVALKLLSLALCQDPVFRERFQREARTAGRLQEPHVVPVHDYGEIDGQLYLDMRLIDGTDLATLLKESGALAPPRAVAIVRQAASALDAAHGAGVVHRDIKPENILVTRDDFAYLVDFGIASATADERLTQMGSAVGTWKYAAPERFSNAGVTESVDIYALACVLHECLTGAPPYRADNTGALITAHLMEPIPHPSQLRPQVPVAFDEVIARGMAKDRKDRYASAGDLAQAAHEALSALDQDRAGHIIEHSQEVQSAQAELTASRPLTPHPPAPPAGPPRHPGGPGTHPAAPGARGVPGYPPSAGAWTGQFAGPPPMPLPRRTPSRRPKLLPGAGAAALLIVALAVWLLSPSSPPPNARGTRTPSETSPPTDPLKPAPAPDAVARGAGEVRRAIGCKHADHHLDHGTHG